MKKYLLAVLICCLLIGCTNNSSNNSSEKNNQGETNIIDNNDNTSDDNSSNLPRMNEYIADNDNGYCANFDVVKFGSYEQDGDTTNGSEAIEWYVIAKENDKSLLISRYMLLQVQLNDKQEETTWENCSLRRYLNNEFYNVTFNEDEKSLIEEVELTNNDNNVWGTIGGNNTSDKVFILSAEDIKNYFPLTYKDEGPLTFNYGSDELFCVRTKAIETDVDHMITEDGFNNASEKYGFTNKSIINTNQTYWWIRTPGKTQTQFTNAAAGIVYEDLNGYVDSLCGVRPAIWVDDAALSMYQ